MFLSPLCQKRNDLKIVSKKENLNTLCPSKEYCDPQQSSATWPSGPPTNFQVKRKNILETSVNDLVSKNGPKEDSEKEEKTIFETKFRGEKTPHLRIPGGALQTQLGRAHAIHECTSLCGGKT